MSSTKTIKVASFLLEFPSAAFKSDGHVSLCVSCGKTISCLQCYFFISQHVNATKHKENKAIKLNSVRISPAPWLRVSSSSKSESVFNTYLFMLHSN